MPKLTRKHWNHPTYRYAYCIERYGNVYTVIDNCNPKAIKGLKFVNDNKRQALEILNQRLIDSKSNIPVVNRTTTLFDAVKEFIELYAKNVSKFTINNYLSTFETYLTEDHPLSDIKIIKNMILESIRVTKHSNNTVRKSMYKLSKLFDFCIENEYITSNPITNSLIPKEVLKELAYPTPDELDIILKAAEKRSHQYALFIKFVSLTGCRVGEALKINWNKSTNLSYIDDTKIYIDGKRKSIYKLNIREIPIDIIPDLRNVIEELRQFELHNNGRLFRWFNQQNVQRWFKDIREELSLNENYSLHSLRKYAANYLERTVGIPPHICNYILGHNQNSRSKYYAHNPSGEDLINMLKVR